MIRSIVPRICSSIDSLVIKSSYCTNHTPKFTDLNNVKLIGTIVSDSFHLPEQRKIFGMKTQIPGTYPSFTNVIYNGRNDYDIGARLIVTGHLKARPIEIGNGKMRTAITVVAHKMFQLEKSEENDDESSSSASSGDENVFNDINQVEITGNVVKDVYEVENFLLLNIATHYNQVFGGVRMTDFHCVKILDGKLRAFVKNNIQIRDRVLINGMLDRKKHVILDGKAKFSGFIVAKDVWKMHQRLPEENTSVKESE